MVMEDDYLSELKKGILTVLSVICEKIENSKNHEHSSMDTMFAIGPNTNANDDVKEKIELLAKFLDVAIH